MATYRMTSGELARYLMKIANDLPMKNEKFVASLAETARKSAERDYSGAEYAGENDVSVSASASYEGLMSKAEVRASGNATLFIEYGTGITKSDAPEARAEIQSGTVLGHGEYGRKNGANEKGWLYKGTPGSNAPSDTEESIHGKGLVHTYGNNATPAMYTARKLVKDRNTYMKAAKEELGNG